MLYVKTANTFCPAGQDLLLQDGVSEVDIGATLGLVIGGAIGAFLWVVSKTVLGYLIGNVPLIKDNLDIAIIVIVLISVAPIAIHRLHARRNRA